MLAWLCTMRASLSCDAKVRAVLAVMRKILEIIRQ